MILKAINFKCHFGPLCSDFILILIQAFIIFILSYYVIYKSINDNHYYINCLMNINLLLFGIINILHLLPIIESQSNCSPPFQEVPYSSGKYCAKCDTTCATCSGSAINQCASCPTDFTLNTDTSTCAAPISSTINTVLNNYHFFNF